VVVGKNNREMHRRPCRDPPLPSFFFFFFFFFGVRKHFPIVHFFDAQCLVTSLSKVRLPVCLHTRTACMPMMFLAFSFSGLALLPLFFAPPSAWPRSKLAGQDGPATLFFFSRETDCCRPTPDPPVFYSDAALTFHGAGPC